MGFTLYSHITSSHPTKVGIQKPLPQTRSDTSSLKSELSVDSFVELDEKTLTKIRYIVEELITTEKVYMQDLQDILMVQGV